MIINFTINNNLEKKSNSIIKSYDEMIDNFWTNEIWKINKSNSHIKNKLVSDYFLQLKNIEKEYNETQVKFSIGLNYDVMIEDNKKKIKKKITNFKKDNLLMLKIHSDCFIEYHKIIFDYLNEKNVIGYYKLDTTNNMDQETNIYPKNIYTLDDDLIKEQIKIFSNEFIEQKNNHKLNDIITVLEKNIFKIKDLISNFINKINPLNPILLTDVENILKSFKIQNFLKSHIDEVMFNKYFKIWNYGYFGNSNDIVGLDNYSITLSEYSSKVKYTEPFTSLNLSIEKKLKLVKIIINKLFKNTSTINILTYSSKLIKSTDSKITDDIITDSETTKLTYSSNQSETSNCTNQSNYVDNLYIPIQYNGKFDIREQDDHLLILLYMILKKINLNPIIVSSDKFKWFRCFDSIQIKNFKILYDYDEGEKKIIIDTPYTPDMYKINSQYYTFPFINYPQLDEDTLQNVGSKVNNDEINLILKTKIKKISPEEIKTIYTYIFNLSIIESNIELNQVFIMIINFCLNYLEYIETKFNKLNDFLLSNSKEKIFKISIETNSNIFDKHEIKYFLILIENYMISIKIYIVMKYIVFKNYSKTDFISLLISNLCKIFDLIIGIYDLINVHIYKIRKLSSSKSELDKLFKKINTIYIYIRKCGYLKKNLF